MSDMITITGNIATEPERRLTGGGVPLTTFRVASSQRYFDRDKKEWVESTTNWYQVSVFRTLGEHAAASLHKGERVIVTGKLRLREWQAGEKKGLSVEIDADAIGHDLLWGTTSYTRAERTPQSWPVPQTSDATATPTGEAQASSWPTSQPVSDDGSAWAPAPGTEAEPAGTDRQADLADAPF
ncbi:single-stranded DNA-binding protein [Microbacterium luticocti]|uniref:single-stranded DNA-binding protein n=1 Tax=Microbacterium luticocti TaxID=451764 RepID=UPI000401F3D7|nr:single-stranded DNA-binding protein [Microbacterium luticocti]